MMLTKTIKSLKVNANAALAILILLHSSSVCLFRFTDSLCARRPVIMSCETHAVRWSSGRKMRSGRETFLGYNSAVLETAIVNLFKL